MDLQLGAPMTPEPLTTRELEQVVGGKIGTAVKCYRHGGRHYWKVGDFWFDFDRAAR